MTADGCGIADVNLPQRSIKWREKSGLALIYPDVFLSAVLADELSKQTGPGARSIFARFYLIKVGAA